MTMNNWLEDLEIGDVIYIPDGYSYPPRLTAYRLIRRTPTQHIIAHAENQQRTHRIRRSDGLTLGLSDYSHFPSYVKKMTDAEVEAVRAEYRHVQLANHLSAVKWRKLSTDQLQRVMAIVEDEK
jgi:hypothetical protein